MEQIDLMSIPTQKQMAIIAMQKIVTVNLTDYLIFMQTMMNFKSSPQRFISAITLPIDFIEIPINKIIIAVLIL